jgi:hypothetical protein
MRDYEWLSWKGNRSYGVTEENYENLRKPLSEPRFETSAFDHESYAFSER